jgi:branched-chain amino acid aminotransferase
LEDIEMNAKLIENERIREAERERHLEKKRLIYINSDRHPNGEFVPELEARISIFDRGFTVGDNAYEYARTYKHKPFQLKEHMSRMFASLRVLRINPGLDEVAFCKLCEELTGRNISLLEKPEEYNIVWEVTRGEWGWHGRRTPAPQEACKPTLIIKNNLNDQKLCAHYFFEGVHVVTPPGRHANPQSWDPKIKTYSRLSYVLADIEARLVDQNATALMLDGFGNLTEAIGANLWLVRDGALMTPTERNILRGQNRNNVTNLAKKLNIPLVYQDLQPWHLYNCDEAFLSTTYPGPFQPIGRFNGILIGKELPGPITKQLAGAWSDWVGIDITGMDRLGTEEKKVLEKERDRLNKERITLQHIPY